ncbi:MAG: sigma 54-interacting transcriptional regulator [Desulfobacterales bacterium]|jgi:formate hydrogenlyase transcriptional activator
MENDQPQSAKNPIRKFKQENTKIKEHEEALPESPAAPDCHRKALSAQLAGVKEQLAAGDECLSRGKEQRKQTAADLNERLLFEGLLFEISARFINIAPDQVDLEIQNALRQILEFFNVDRCGLVRISPRENSFRITHVAYASDIPAVPEKTDLSLQLFPWVYEQIIQRHEVVSFTSLDELPGEAAVDLQTYERLKIRSALNIPITLGASSDYAISINSVKKECTFPEEYIPRLRLLGEILVNTLRLAQTRHQLDDRLRFEGLISDLSAGFVNISYTEIEGKINKWLQRITEFFDADRCTLGLFSEDGAQLCSAFEYHLPEVEPAPVSLSKAQLPWYLLQLMHGNLVVINRLEDLPDDAEAERRLCQAKGMKSVLSIPMISGGRTLGSCALVAVRGERIWPQDLVQRLRLITSVFAGALARKRSEESLRESEARLNLAADSAEAGLWILEIAGGYIWATEKTRELYGFAPGQELDFEGFIRIVDSEDRARIRRSVEQAVRTREDFREEYRIVHPDGSIRWMDARGRPYFNPSGEAERLMGVSIDISERKQMEDQLRARLEEIEGLKQQLEKENIYLREEIQLQNVHEEIVGRSQAMKQILAQVEQVARTDSTVLIQGETGTGKELVARAVHRLGARKDRSLVTVNCASLPPTLIESELFGRERGAYTGALTRMTGRFEVADGATLFLDEIGDLPLDVQAKLLRVLEEGRFERLGSTKPLRVNVRIIAATNRDLARDVAEGKFRKDLYYRLNVFPIAVPPLRERPEDIPLLVWTFVRQYEKKMGKRIDHISRKNMEDLQHYPWPGNARELRNVVEHAMIVSSGKTLEAHAPRTTPSDIPASLSLQDAERRHILGVLQKSGWRLTGPGGAAEILGLKRTTLQSRMKKLGIKRPAR